MSWIIAGSCARALSALWSGMVGSLITVLIAISTTIVSGRPSARSRSGLATCCAFAQTVLRVCVALQE